MSMCSRPRKPQRKPKPSAVGDLRLVVQRRVVQLELGERIAEALVVLGVHREQAGEHARLDLLEARQRRCARAALQRDGVADRRAIDLLDAGDDEAHLARRPASRRGSGLGVKRPSRRRTWLRPVDITRILSPSFSVPLTTRTSDTTPDVVVEPGVDDQRLQRRGADRPWAAGCAG